MRQLMLRVLQKVESLTLKLFFKRVQIQLSPECLEDFSSLNFV